MAFHFNRNVCRTFNLTTSSLKQFESQECSEVIVLARTGTTNAAVNVYDRSNPSVPWPIEAGKEFIFRGVTNSNQLSADKDCTYRTQYYGSMTDL
jgi:hypothetical protein